MKAFILAAGYGTRLRPLTNDIPKALVKINNIPLLEILLKKLQRFGFQEVMINIHYLADKILEFLEKKDFGLKIYISDEQDQILDTGGAIKKAKNFFDQPVLIHNVDILSDIDFQEFMNYYFEKKALALLAVRKRKTKRSLSFDNQGLCAWKENDKILIEARKCNNSKDYGFSGIHIVSPKLLDFMPEKKVFSIIEAYINAAKTNQILPYDHTCGLWFDVGTLEKLKQIQQLDIQLFI